MRTAKNQLTARQQQFCQHYVGSARHNSALAARLAGYAIASSHVTGCQLLQKPKIAAVVRGLEECVAVEIGVTRQKVINELVGAFDMAKLMDDPASMVAAMRQVALMCGYNNQQPPTVAVDMSGQVELARLQRMSNEELAALIAAGKMPHD